MAGPKISLESMVTPSSRLKAACSQYVQTFLRSWRYHIRMELRQAVTLPILNWRSYKIYVLVVGELIFCVLSDIAKTTKINFTNLEQAKFILVVFSCWRTYFACFNDIARKRLKTRETSSPTSKNVNAAFAKPTVIVPIISVHWVLLGTHRVLLSSPRLSEVRHLVVACLALPCHVGGRREVASA